VGATNGWRMDHGVPGSEIVELINAQMPIEPAEANYRGEVARRWRYRDGGGEIGVITSISEPFCGDCTRARLSPEGELYTCLFGVRGHDFRGSSRSDRATPKSRPSWLRSASAMTATRIRSEDTVGLRKVEMSHRRPTAAGILSHRVIAAIPCSA
jgi:cyclic pyranopterin phosphate synthase